MHWDLASLSPVSGRQQQGAVFWLRVAQTVYIFPHKSNFKQNSGTNICCQIIQMNGSTMTPPEYEMTILILGFYTSVHYSFLIIKKLYF